MMPRDNAVVLFLGRASLRWRTVRKTTRTGATVRAGKESALGLASMSLCQMFQLHLQHVETFTFDPCEARLL